MKASDFPAKDALLTWNANQDIEDFPRCGNAHKPQITLKLPQIPATLQANDGPK